MSTKEIEDKFYEEFMEEVEEIRQEVVSINDEIAIYRKELKEFANFNLEDIRRERYELEKENRGLEENINSNPESLLAKSWENSRNVNNEKIAALKEKEEKLKLKEKIEDLEKQKKARVGVLQTKIEKLIETTTKRIVEAERKYSDTQGQIKELIGLGTDKYKEELHARRTRILEQKEELEALYSKLGNLKSEQERINSFLLEPDSEYGEESKKADPIKTVTRETSDPTRSEENVEEDKEQNEIKQREEEIAKLEEERKKLREKRKTLKKAIPYDEEAYKAVSKQNEEIVKKERNLKNQVRRKKQEEIEKKEREDLGEEKKTETAPISNQTINITIQLLNNVENQKILENLNKEDINDVRRLLLLIIGQNSEILGELKKLNIDTKDIITKAKDAIGLIDSKEKSEDKKESNNGVKDKRNTQESSRDKVSLGYKDLLEMYNEDLEKLYELQAKVENGEIDYSAYEKHADYMVGRYEVIKREFQLANEEYKKKVEEINLKFPTVTQENGEKNEFSDLTDEELQVNLEELDKELGEEYEFRDHMENGMEGHEDNDLSDRINKIKEEIKRRERKKAIGELEEENPEKPEQPMMILDREGAPIPPKPTLQTNLGYKDLLEMYKEDLEKLYELQSKVENGEIDYGVYEEHADYMVGRYEVIKREFQLANEEYTKKVEEINLKFPTVTQENGEKNEFSDLTDDILQAKLEELNRKFEEEYRFRAHMENGTEEHVDDDLLDKMNKMKEEIEKEIKRRERKKAIDELEEEKPEKPDKPMMILKKDEKQNENLPIRSFWEIYNSTCTEHVGTIPTILYKAAKMKILPRKDSDTLTKILSGVLVIPKLLLKGGAVIPNAIMGTTKKMEEMQGLIDDLSPEEFEILVTSPEKIEEMFGTDQLKDSFDRDYLEPQFMKQYKVNEIYLRAVESRLSRERNAAIEYFRAEVNACDQRIEQLEEIREDRELTSDEQREYNETTQRRGEYVANGTKCREEIDLFNDGIKKKSNGFKNISGWFLGKFNPDNREQNQKMSELSKRRREVSARGNEEQVSSISNEMRNFSTSQTRIYGRKNDTVDRGAYSIEGPIEMLDKGEENRGKLLLTNIALATAIVDFVGQIRRIADNRIAIENHNREIENANRDNSDIQVSGTIEGKGVDDAREAASRVVTDGKFSRNERANWDVDDWRRTDRYVQTDVATHTDGGNAARDIEDALSRGDTAEAWKVAADYAKKGAQGENKEMFRYAKDNPQFDYNAVDATYESDIDMLGRFLLNPSYNTTVSGTMVSTLEGIKQGVSPLALIFAGANALHQGAKQGTKDSFRNSIRANKARRRASKKAKHESDNTMEDIENR